MKSEDELYLAGKHAKTFEEYLEVLKESAKLPYEIPGYKSHEDVRAIYVMLEQGEDLEKAHKKIIRAAPLDTQRDFVPGGIMHERCKIVTPDKLVFISFECRGDIDFFSQHVFNCAKALGRLYAEFTDEIFSVSNGKGYDLKYLEVAEF